MIAARAAALTILLAAGPALADDARGFWLGDVDADDHVELTLTPAQFTCEVCQNTDPIDVGIADLAGQAHLADGLAVFGQVSVVRRGEQGGVDGDADTFAGPLTLGLRQRVALARRDISLAVVPSVTIPRTGGGGNANSTVQVAQLLRPDASLYPVRIGTARLSVEARWRPGRAWLAGGLTAAVHGIESIDRAYSARAVASAGISLAAGVTAVAEGSVTLVRDGAACGTCEPDGSLQRGFVGAGVRAAVGHVLGALHVGRGLDDSDTFTLRWPVVVDVTVGGRW